MTNRVCRHCKTKQPITAFAVANGYRVWMCNSCRSAAATRNRECAYNRKINRLIGWAPVERSAVR